MKLSNKSSFSCESDRIRYVVYVKTAHMGRKKSSRDKSRVSWTAMTCCRAQFRIVLIHNWNAFLNFFPSGFRFQVLVKLEVGILKQIEWKETDPFARALVSGKYIINLRLCYLRSRYFPGFSTAKLSPVFLILRKCQKYAHTMENRKNGPDLKQAGK